MVAGISLTPEVSGAVCACSYLNVITMMFSECVHLATSLFLNCSIFLLSPGFTRPGRVVLTKA